MTELRERIVEPETVRRSKTWKVDVCVIGTGAGGAVVARELAEAGVNVLMLEEGPYYTGRDYGESTALEAARMLYRKSGYTFTVGNQPVLLPFGRCVGGTTVINSGTTLRALPSAVERWTEQAGLRNFTAALDEYYARVEQVLNVSPVPEKLFGENGRIFRRGAEKMGYRGKGLLRNQRDCCGCGRCFLGCPHDAKQATQVSYVPLALKAGARVLTGCRADRIWVESGRVRGVRASVRHGRLRRRLPVTVEAQLVVVAAGAIFTPLLLRKVKGRTGTGLGGKLSVHPATRVLALFDREVRGWRGVPQGYHLEEALEEGVSIEGVFMPPTLTGPSLPGVGYATKELMSQFHKLAALGCRAIEDTGRGKVLPRVMGWPLIWYWVDHSDVERLKKATVMAAELQFAAGARQVFTGIQGHELLRSARELERLRQARVSPTDIELSAYHAQGTARMGTEPGNSVVDPRGEVWGVRNLYVADASVMPSTPIVNPQLSIQAFATHIARGLLRSRGRELVPQRPLAENPLCYLARERERLRPAV